MAIPQLLFRQTPMTFAFNGLKEVADLVDAILHPREDVGENRLVPLDARENCALDLALLRRVFLDV